jgi:hypothetical protein
VLTTDYFLSGGLDVRAQEASLRLHPDIVIATPGRLIDLLHNAPSFTLAHVEILVLDEADRYGRIVGEAAANYALQHARRIFCHTND